MPNEGTQIKAQVRQFYDQVGWQQEADGLYQNAHYEDLRLVSYEYIHRCHLRVNRFLQPSGRYLLDAGSGPIQYPEYLSYSQNYTYRVCLDISIVALEEARKRIAGRGLFVVADVANLPFKPDVFDGIVSLHTLHHLPADDQKKAYLDLHRTLKPGASMVVVNGWTVSPLMNRLQPLVNGAEGLARLVRLSRHPLQGATPQGCAEAARRYPIKGGFRKIRLEGAPETRPERSAAREEATFKKPTGTFVQKQDAAGLKQELDGLQVEIRVWRSLSVRFLRAVIKGKLGGRLWLKLVFWLEDCFPHYFGAQGQYPLVIIRKK